MLALLRLSRPRFRLYVGQTIYYRNKSPFVICSVNEIDISWIHETWVKPCQPMAIKSDFVLDGFSLELNGPTLRRIFNEIPLE